MRYLVSVAVLFAATSAFAEGPEGPGAGNPPGKPGHRWEGPAGSNSPRGARPPGSGSGGPEFRGPRPVGSNAESRGPRPGSSSGMPEGMQERMAKLRERQAEMKERHERARKLDGELHTELHQKNPDAAALRKKFEEYKELRKDRQRDHRLTLHRRYRTALARPEVKQELERHARRSARLRRMEMVIATERKGADREKLLLRVTSLREQEDKRHDQAMTNLAPSPASATPPTPAADGAAEAPQLARPPVTPPAPAPSGGAQ